MILAVDIGNTNIVVGCIKGEEICFVERMSTEATRTELEYAISFKNVLEMYGISIEQLDGGIISSVVPPAYIQYLGKVLPYAVIGLLVIYCLKDVPASSTYGLPEAIAILFIMVLHKWKKNTLLSIGGGTILYMILVQMVF